MSRANELQFFNSSYFNSDETDFVALHAPNSVLQFSFLRIGTWLDFTGLWDFGSGCAQSSYVGIVDTGASVTLIPASVHALFDPQKLKACRLTDRHGHSIPYEGNLGKGWFYALPVECINIPKGSQWSMTLVAVLTQPPSDPSDPGHPILIGLRGGYFESRSFHMTPKHDATHGHRCVLFNH